MTLIEYVVLVASSGVITVTASVTEEDTGKIRVHIYCMYVHTYRIVHTLIRVGQYQISCVTTSDIKENFQYCNIYVYWQNNIKYYHQYRGYRYIHRS